MYKSTPSVCLYLWKMHISLILINFRAKQAINKLLRSYQKSLSSEVILSAIAMYEQRKKESLGKVDDYGGRTLREARKEIEDDELDR